MIEVPITPAIIIAAEEMFRTHKSTDSMRLRTDKAPGNTDWTGCVGQAVFAAALKERQMPYQFVNTTRRDFIVCGLRVEVKTKAYTVQPQVTHQVSLYDYIIDHQTCDYYAFVFLQLAEGERRDGPPHAGRFQRAWIAGVKESDEYKKEGYEVKKGEQLLNGVVAMFDSLNLHASQLRPIETLGGPENE
jgi:hypothetical protein